MLIKNGTTVIDHQFWHCCSFWSLPWHCTKNLKIYTCHAQSRVW